MSEDKLSQLRSRLPSVRELGGFVPYAIGDGKVLCTVMKGKKRVYVALDPKPPFDAVYKYYDEVRRINEQEYVEGFWFTRDGRHIYAPDPGEDNVAYAVNVSAAIPPEKADAIKAKVIEIQKEMLNTYKHDIKKVSVETNKEMEKYGLFGAPQGAYQAETDSIFLNADCFEPETIGRTHDDIKFIYDHEVGHNVWHNELHPLEQEIWKDWDYDLREAYWNSPIKRKDSHDKSVYRSVGMSAYAENSFTENWAEAFAEVFQQPFADATTTGQVEMARLCLGLPSKYSKEDFIAKVNPKGILSQSTVDKISQHYDKVNKRD